MDGFETDFVSIDETNLEFVLSSFNHESWSMTSFARSLIRSCWFFQVTRSHFECKYCLIFKCLNAAMPYIKNWLFFKRDKYTCRTGNVFQQIWQLINDGKRFCFSLDVYQVELIVRYIIRIYILLKFDNKALTFHDSDWFLLNRIKQKEQVASFIGAEHIADTNWNR